MRRSKGPVVSIEGVVERHNMSLPRFVVVPTSALHDWGLEGTTVVEGTLNGASLGRRSLKRWDEDRWFMDLPESLCRLAAVEVGDTVELRISVASDELPDELVHLLEDSPAASAKWERMTESQRRMLREHVLAAKRPETRARRARNALGLDLTELSSGVSGVRLLSSTALSANRSGSRRSSACCVSLPS